MNGKCNALILDEDALFSVLRHEAHNALAREGEKQIAHMRREVKNTTHGGAPGKPAWRDEISQNLTHVATVVTGDSISMDFGCSPSHQSSLVRAMIVEEGSGSAVGNAAIQAGPTGRSVWNEDVTGKHPSRAKTVYNLPPEFNQTGNQFTENAVRMTQSEFGEAAESVFSAIPDCVYYDNVRVDEP